jgi:signal transduction histidine kinase
MPRLRVPRPLARPRSPAIAEPSIAWLLVAFLAVASTFILATVFTHHITRQIDRAADDIASNYAPSIEHLATVRVEVTRLERALAPYVEATPGSRPPRARLSASLAAIDLEMQRYTELPLAPGELPYRERLRGALAELKDAADHVITLADSGSAEEARSEYRGRLRTSASGAEAAAMEDIGFNARGGRESAVFIKRERENTLVWGLALDVLSLAVAVIAGLVLAWQVRRHGQLLAAHAGLLEDRALELESFASRVAHDILNPVGAAQVAVELALRQDAASAPGRQALEGAIRGLRRAGAIIDGLLQFARAGARSPPGAASDVEQVVRDVVDGVADEAARAGAEVRLGLSPCAAACEAGVMTSIVSNLISNALKYAMDGPVRRIEVRAARRGPRARVEVEDAGPGLPRDLLPRVFDVYVRASNYGKPGLGIGLATVKRLVEGHGGRLGVESKPGCGSLFWFEMPAAELPRGEAGERQPGR